MGWLESFFGANNSNGGTHLNLKRDSNRQEMYELLIAHLTKVDGASFASLIDAASILGLAEICQNEWKTYVEMQFDVLTCNILMQVCPARLEMIASTQQRILTLLPAAGGSAGALDSYGQTRAEVLGSDYARWPALSSTVLNAAKCLDVSIDTQLIPTLVPATAQLVHAAIDIADLLYHASYDDASVFAGRELRCDAAISPFISAFNRIADLIPEPSHDALHYRRFKRVLEAFRRCPNEYQQNLTDLSIIWVVASLANHQEQSKCETCFRALIDWMYASTEEARTLLSDSEQQELAASANMVLHQLGPVTGKIAEAASDQLAKSDADNSARMTAECLNHVRFMCLNHAAPSSLHDLIKKCFVLLGTLKVFQMGGSSDQNLIDAMKAVCEVCVSISDCPTPD